MLLIRVWAGLLIRAVTPLNSRRMLTALSKEVRQTLKGKGRHGMAVVPQQEDSF